MTLLNFRKREKTAASIAREIEGDVSSQNRVELENGDEEEAFSAVVRPGQGGGHHYQRKHEDESSPAGNNKYVPPAKRQNSRGSDGPNRGGHQPSPR